AGPATVRRNAHNTPDVTGCKRCKTVNTASDAALHFLIGGLRKEAHMKRAIGILLALALFTGAGFAQARGGHGGGGHGGGARSGGAVAARPAMSGGFSHFTTGPMRFTTGQPTQFTTGAQRWRPPLLGHAPGVVRPIPLPPQP